MRDEDKPFVCVRNGWNIKISPRNVSGWLSFALWMAGFFAMTGLFAWAMAVEDKPVLHATYTGVFIVAAIVWSVVMIRWMMARSEMIDLAAIGREQSRAKRKG